MCGVTFYFAPTLLTTENASLKHTYYIPLTIDVFHILMQIKEN